jgi:SAM-dependent methyltransferase
MPILDCNSPRFVYSVDPTQVIDWTGKVVSKSIPPWSTAECSGSSQLIPFRGSYLAIVHERVHRPGFGQRQYQRRFVKFDADFHVIGLSRRFSFTESGEGEFCCGLCWHPDGERFVVTYGVLDREAWIGTVLADDVCIMLDREEVVHYTIPSGRTPPHNATPPVNHAGGGTPPLRYNQPLLTQSQVDEAVRERTSRGLPLHNDVVPWKNWDNWLATLACPVNDKDAPILDAGGDHNSAFLPGLVKLGYTRLLNVNIDGAAGVPDGINHLKADITDMYLVRDSNFAFVACLSVIEHGVDWRKFFREMARVIRPNGRLFISFDYWGELIDAGDRTAFGAPVRIIDATEVQAMVTYATGLGFLLDGDELDLQCCDPVVNWMGLDFTFMSLLFHRTVDQRIRG